MFKQKLIEIREVQHHMLNTEKSFKKSLKKLSKEIEKKAKKLFKEHLPELDFEIDCDMQGGCKVKAWEQEGYVRDIFFKGKQILLGEDDSWEELIFDELACRFSSKKIKLPYTKQHVQSKIKEISEILGLPLSFYLNYSKVYTETSDQE